MGTPVTRRALLREAVDTICPADSLLGFAVGLPAVVMALPLEVSTGDGLLAVDANRPFSVGLNSFLGSMRTQVLLDQ